MITYDETSFEAKAATRALELRAARLAGMRAMCDWLEAHPDTPMPIWDTINLPLTTNARTESWADEHGVRDLVKYDDEGNASLDYVFGAVSMHVYGYVDFAERCDRQNARTARQYADKHGLELVDTAEQQAALDAEGAETVMSASERFEHDQADEAAIDAADDARWGAAQDGSPF